MSRVNTCSALAVLILLAAGSLEGDKFLEKADEKFEQSATRAQEWYAKSMGDAYQTRLKTYRTILAAATKAGDFDRATAIKERIETLEAEAEEHKSDSKVTSKRNRLQILSATYGINQSWFDVTDKVAAKADGKPMWTTVVSDNDWGDPAPGYAVGNTLVVRYAWNGNVGMKAIYEGQEISLP